MKRIVKSVVVLGVVSLASVATLRAQAPGRASFHIGGGIVLPVGDFGDSHKTGFQAIGGVSFGLAGLPFSLRVDGMYGQNSVDGVSGVKTSYFGGMAGAQFNLGSGPSPLKPYILAQAGMVSSKASGGGLSSNSESDFALAGGGGLQFNLGSMNAFLEAKYMRVMSDPSAGLVPILFGIRFGGGM